VVMCDTVVLIRAHCLSLPLKLASQPTYNVHQTTMSEILNFILDHEDSFKNRARLASLWSDFPLHKVSNPDGYIANSNAWKRALFHATRAGVIPTVADQSTKSGEKQSGRNDTLIMTTGQELARALENRPWGIPSGLASVVVSVAVQLVVIFADKRG